jgi:hypothetical protein
MRLFTDKDETGVWAFETEADRQRFQPDLHEIDETKADAIRETNKPKPEVPNSVPAADAVDALIDADLWEDVQNAVNNMSGKEQAKTENLLMRATTWHRDNAALQSLATQLSISAEHMDKLFCKAGGVDYEATR